MPDVEQIVEDALECISLRLLIEEPCELGSHSLLVARGFELPEIRVALGRYLTAAVAGVVQADASLDAALVGGDVEERAEVLRAVHVLIGKDNDFVEGQLAFRDTRRNAWIGEGAAAITARNA